MFGLGSILFLDFVAKNTAMVIATGAAILLTESIKYAKKNEK